MHVSRVEKHLSFIQRIHPGKGKYYAKQCYSAKVEQVQTQLTNTYKKTLPQGGGLVLWATPASHIKPCQWMQHQLDLLSKMREEKRSYIKSLGTTALQPHEKEERTQE